MQGELGTVPKSLHKELRVCSGGDGLGLCTSHPVDVAKINCTLSEQGLPLWVTFPHVSP